MNERSASHSGRHEGGFALIAALLMLSVLVAMLGAFSLTTRVDIATQRATQDGTTGFYAAEGGLNARAETIRQIFVGYNLPSGTSPTEPNECTGSNNGSGSFACQAFTFGTKRATTWVIQDPTNPKITVIPPGERYQNLNAQEYRYTANSIATSPDGRVGAVLRLNFKSRLVPLFQFAAFYNKDLEILPGPTMTLSGPVHTNGALFLNAGNTLTITGQVTTGRDLYRGRKNSVNGCSGTVTVGTRNLPGCSGSNRRLLTATDVAPWTGGIQVNVPQVTVPGPEVFDPSPSALYWSRADLRLALRLNAAENANTTYSSTAVEVRNPDDSVDTVLTNRLNACTGGVIGGRVANYNPNFRNLRENEDIRMLDVDLQALFNCIHSQNLLMNNRALNDDTEGGLVFHFTVDGPNRWGQNRYGVRVRNGDELRATVGGAPAIKGFTLVSDQAVYLWGHFNRVNKKPAAVMCDSINILSSAWDDADDSLALTHANRNAVATTVNAAFLAGTDSTWNVENQVNGGTDTNAGYNGGLENFPRFHEDWANITLVYRGSFVSLNTPRHVNGPWLGTGIYYNPPIRDWNYDTSYNNAANLPPITPRFVYLRQEFFGREYEVDSTQ